MNKKDSQHEWSIEYEQVKAAKEEMVKLLKVAIISSNDIFAIIKFRIDNSLINLLPTEVNNHNGSGEIIIRCDFNEDKWLGNYTTDNYNQWFMNYIVDDDISNTSEEINISYNNLLNFLTKIQYMINVHNNDVVIS